MLSFLQSNYVQNLLDFIFPQLCLGCGEYSEMHICQSCEKKIKIIKHPYCLRCMTYIEHGVKCQSCLDKTLALYSYANYDEPMRDIIIQYKFKGITKPASIFAQRILTLFSGKLQEHRTDYLIPIPLHTSRKNQRGYNQAEIFAKKLSMISGIPLENTILYRVKKRKPQAKLAVADREKNIDSVFHVEKKSSDLKKCVLVDDVVTTGSTVLEATKMLENSGYKVVAVISIAHAF